MTFALFANGSLNTQGGWLDLRELGTLEECQKASLWGCDWAHIVNTETGEIVGMKQRTKKGQDMTDVPWDRPHADYIDPDVPVLFRAELARDELGKLAALGGAAWLRAKIAEAEVMNPPPQASAADLLKFLQSAKMPVHLTEPTAVARAQDLVRGGLIEAVLSEPAGYSATVISITPEGATTLLPSAPAQ